MLPRIAALLFVIAPAAPRAEVPAPPEDAPTSGQVPTYTSRCESCAATGLINVGYDRFEAHVLSTDVQSPAMQLFDRQRRATSLVIAGTAVGVALAVTGLALVPPTCAEVDRFTRPPVPASCALGLQNFAIAGLGAAAITSGVVGFLVVRPSEPEIVAAINAFNHENPARPFLLNPSEVAWAGPEHFTTPEVTRPGLHLLRPKVVIPLAAGIVAAGGSGIMLSEAARQHQLLASGTFVNLTNAHEISAAGTRAQLIGLALGGLSAAALSVGGFFLYLPEDAGSVQVAIGPGSAAVAGTF